MISELKINNYKSLHDVTLDVGRFNVLIGENGCGKSNLLEAITFAAAAEANKLDNEFLTSRGIRVTEPTLMRSAFENDNVEKEIKIHVKFKDAAIEETYTLNNDNQPYSKWFYSERRIAGGKLNYENTQISQYAKNRIQLFMNNLQLESSLSDASLDDGGIIYNLDKELKIIFQLKDEIGNFIIYSPENTALRNFNKEGQIEPLGINGEGLFKLLKVIQNKSPEQWKEIQNCLQLFDWYDGFKIPRDSQSEDKITINDHYLTMDFDQRSANEGFLFVLFYIALMVSDDTPKIFAIDNIDTSLNPKLCTKIIKELIRLAKKYDKQVFVTTHNPAILDGIDLGDDEQRLFVVSRNKTGHTRFKRITSDDKPKSSARSRISRLIDKDENLLSETKNYILNLFDNSEEPLKLSEAFLRGYLGGLPTGF
ncbi:MAG: AAA family ATPase [Methylococcales bacterium]|nr:AAA family ATPase [Methylococcales bacterium]